MKTLQTIILISLGFFGYMSFMFLGEFQKLNTTQERQADIAEAELMVSLYNKIEDRFNDCYEALPDIQVTDVTQAGDKIKDNQEFCSGIVSDFPEVEMIIKYFGRDKLPSYVK